MDLIRYAEAEVIARDGVSAATFGDLYREAPPWEIGRPQPEVVRLESAGLFRGTILDIGCGTGENAIFLASKGYQVCAIDFVPQVIALARSNARARNLSVDFASCDALEFAPEGRSFDTLLDCATFHTFSDRQRVAYTKTLYALSRPNARLHLICFSELEDRVGGPRRVSIREIANAFGEQWDVLSVRPSRYLATWAADGMRAWTAELQRR
jgi:SAM-dependent methyltransferase